MQAEAALRVHAPRVSGVCFGWLSLRAGANSAAGAVPTVQLPTEQLPECAALQIDCLEIDELAPGPGPGFHVTYLTTRAWYTLMQI